MPQAAPIPALAIDDLERFAAPGLVALFDAEELGAFARLLQHAWRSDPPCTLPTDDVQLARIAKTDRWERIRPMILRAFTPPTPTTTPDQLPAHRLVNAVAREIYEAASLEHLNRSERNRANALCRSSGKAERPASQSLASRKPVASESLATRSAAPSLRSESLAQAPQRTDQSNESKRPAERSEGADSVLAVLGAGAQAREGAVQARWCIDQSMNLMENESLHWSRLQLNCGTKAKRKEIASAPNVSPAIVETAIQICRDEIERRQKARPGVPIDFNPIGKIIVLLGLRRDGKNLPPVEPNLIIARKWDERLREMQPMFRAQASLDARRADSLTKGISALGGGA